MVDTEEYPLNLTGYNFMLSIGASPTPPTGAFGTLALQTSFPSSGSGNGSVSYLLSAQQTAQLMVETAYQYSAVAQAPGSDPSMLQYGSIQLIDVPQMVQPVHH
jgi:hypothetical protein